MIKIEIGESPDEFWKFRGCLLSERTMALKPMADIESMRVHGAIYFHSRSRVFGFEHGGH
jgi:hypothetical protein